MGLFFTKPTKEERLAYILQYVFPVSFTIQLTEALREKLNSVKLVESKQIEILQTQLKQFFYVTVNCEKPIAIPSTLIDYVWYQFTLNKKVYKEFCKKAFGYELKRELKPLDLEDYRQEDFNAWEAYCYFEKIVTGAFLPREMPNIYKIDQMFEIDSEDLYNKRLWLIHLYNKNRYYYGVKKDIYSEENTILSVEEALVYLEGSPCQRLLECATRESREKPNIFLKLFIKLKIYFKTVILKKIIFL